MNEPARQNSFGTLSSMELDGQTFAIHDLRALAHQGFAIDRIPYSLRVLLENLLRNEDGRSITAGHVRALIDCATGGAAAPEILFHPCRVLMQDHTGLAALSDLAALRDAVARQGGDPMRVNPLRPATVVVDHSVQVESFGQSVSLQRNMRRELELNRERYEFFRWAQSELQGLKVVPPGVGICHQVNLELLGEVVRQDCVDGITWAYPDSVVGTDSHTPMINGLSILGWGVGGIEAAAVMLGQPIPMLVPEVVGVRLSGKLRVGVTITDLVLAVTELLRKTKVVGNFVEFFGPGVDQLSVPDRSTLANMCPEYGATVGYFAIDQHTIDYLRLTNREPAAVALVEAYARRQGLFHTPDDVEPIFARVVELDLSGVETCIAGPRLPQQRIPLTKVPQRVRALLAEAAPVAERVEADAAGLDGENDAELPDGAVVLAAITSCTNTSNPSAMLAAGVLARNAVNRGLSVRPWVKTSLSPGSRAVPAYLEAAGLLPYLEALRFHVVGYGCMTCIGNSGPLAPGVQEALEANKTTATAVLSGNRNFESRIHPAVRMNFLASPALVVAYAIAGRIDIDFELEPIAADPEGVPIFLRDLWPSPQAMASALAASADPTIYRDSLGDSLQGSPDWQALQAPGGTLFSWPTGSTYLNPPPYIDGAAGKATMQDIHGARALVLLGDSVTTDHISPAGTIDPESEAGRYLRAQGVPQRDFNTFSTRRGNHEVMVRGTFGNKSLVNALVPGRIGPWTRVLPQGETTTIYQASLRYAEQATPLVVIAGQEYGTGSSRDWAAKGTRLLGVRAVLARSFERIHRSNLIGMGVLPLQFEGDVSAESLGLKGDESFEITGLSQGVIPRQRLRVCATREDGTQRCFDMVSRVDTPVEAEYLTHGGILPFMLQRLVSTHEELVHE